MTLGLVGIGFRVGAKRLSNKFRIISNNIEFFSTVNIDVRFFSTAWLKSAGRLLFWEHGKTQGSSGQHGGDPL